MTKTRKLTSSERKNLADIHQEFLDKNVQFGIIRCFRRVTLQPTSEEYHFEIEYLDEDADGNWQSNHIRPAPIEDLRNHFCSAKPVKLKPSKEDLF